MFRLASFGRFFPYLRPYRLRMAAAALLVMSAAGTNLSMLWVIRRLVDTVLVQRDPAALNTAIAELGALFLVQGLLIMGHSYLTASAGQRIIADFRMHLFNHLQSLSLGFFARRRTGELMSRLMNDVGALQTTLTEIPIDLAKQVVTLVGGLTILFVMNWMVSPPTSVTTCFARSIGISVKVVCSAPTSFMSRDINSPVRRRAKNPKERLCRWLKRCIRKSAIMRWPAEAVR